MDPEDTIEIAELEERKMKNEYVEGIAAVATPTKTKSSITPTKRKRSVSPAKYAAQEDKPTMTPLEEELLKIQRESSLAALRMKQERHAVKMEILDIKRQTAILEFEQTKLGNFQITSLSGNL
ncbi:uncharacterized protein [Amphiura filiformis]|uniref:uncharacterized protein n=1 Tax=Amphiura filiformis TaxID=82378 RepID=UPI003B21CCCD